MQFLSFDCFTGHDWYMSSYHGPQNNIVGVSVSENSRGAQILQFFAPRWLSTISYLTRACCIFVKYHAGKESHGGGGGGGGGVGSEKNRWTSRARITDPTPPPNRASRSLIPLRFLC